MSSEDTLRGSGSGTGLTPELIAEASAWLAVLHGPNRTGDAERGFKEWLRKSPQHSRAFEEATTVWEESKAVREHVARRYAFDDSVRSTRRSQPPPTSSRIQSNPTQPRPSPSGRGEPRAAQSISSATQSRPAQSRPTQLRWAAAACVLAVIAAGVGAWAYLHDPEISTQIGEQRILTLDDGSQVTLNTNSSIVVKYDEAQRRIELRSGEALFEVAKRNGWPFIVTSANHDIQALGTTFAVRLDDNDRSAITLIEGKVRVTDRDGGSGPSDDEAAATALASTSASGATGNTAITLSPGERLSFSGGEVSPHLDKPPLDRVLAWKNREVALDNAPLTEAIAEMNRYSRVRLVAEGAGTGDIRVTGLFRAGDSMSFARAVAEVYRLEVTEAGREIHLARANEVRPEEALNRRAAGEGHL